MLLKASVRQTAGIAYHVPVRPCVAACAPNDAACYEWIRKGTDAPKAAPLLILARFIPFDPTISR